MVKRRLSSRKNITTSFGYIFRLVITNPSQSYHKKIILPSYFQQNIVYKIFIGYNVLFLILLRSYALLNYIWKKLYHNN